MWLTSCRSSAICACPCSRPESSICRISPVGDFPFLCILPFCFLLCCVLLIQHGHARTRAPTDGVSLCGSPQARSFASRDPTEGSPAGVRQQARVRTLPDGSKRECAAFEVAERSEPEGCASRRGRATLPATAGGGVEGDVWLSRQWKRQGAYLKELIVKSKTRGITNDEKELFKRGTNANKCI